ncbi:hypothetical protein KKB18_09020 [bacterium]|nr:hypothetical protein [bacterium]
MKEFDPADFGGLHDEEVKKHQEEEELHLTDEQLIDIARLEKEKEPEIFKDITDEDFDEAFIRRDAIVKIYTSQFKIIGNILIPAEGSSTRLTDLMNIKDRGFIPITNARVMSLTSGKVIDSDCFVVINKSEINIIVPIKEPPKPDTEVKY